MEASRDQSGRVGDIRKQKGADFISYLAKSLEVERSAVRTCTGNDSLRSNFLCCREDFVVIDQAGLWIDSIKMRFEQAAGEVHPETVSKVAPFLQAESQDLVSGLHKCEVCRHVCVCA